MSWMSGNSIRLRKQTRFAALRKLPDDEDLNWGWENIKENIKTSAKESLELYELKQQKPWFDEKRLSF